MSRGAVAARTAVEHALMEAQGLLLVAANGAVREGDERTARDARTLLALAYEVTAEHTKRAG